MSQIEIEIDVLFSFTFFSIHTLKINKKTFTKMTIEDRKSIGFDDNR